VALQARSRPGGTVRILAAATLILSAADHWTTYLCLRNPIAGWDVIEANPLADWLFSWIGLVPGLLIDSVVTVFAVGFLLWTNRLSRYVKVAFFGLVTLTTGYAVINNFRAIDALGLSPLGLG
jgi:hypothetical protein